MKKKSLWAVIRVWKLQVFLTENRNRNGVYGAINRRPIQQTYNGCDGASVLQEPLRGTWLISLRHWGDECVGESEYITRQGFDALTGRELILLLFPCHHSVFSLLTLSLILDKLTSRWIIVPPLGGFTSPLHVSSVCFSESVPFLLHLLLIFFFVLFPLVFAPSLCSTWISIAEAWHDIQLGEGVNVPYKRKKKKIPRFSQVWLVTIGVRGYLSVLG